MFVPDGTAPGLASVGACAGVFARDAALEHAAARRRGARARRARAGGPGGRRRPSVAGDAGRRARRVGRRVGNGKQFVDLQNDVTADDVALAARENYRSVEHLKRYTTTGMGTDQGKTSNVNALVLMGECTGRAPAEVGTTKFRPPFAPVTLGFWRAGARGALYRPLKRLPDEDWHRERGALFEQYGDWWRPAAYPLAGESSRPRRSARPARCAATRDCSTAPRSASWKSSDPTRRSFSISCTWARCRRSRSARRATESLLNENGIVVDDGIVARLAAGSLLGQHHERGRRAHGGGLRGVAAMRIHAASKCW